MWEMQIRTSQGWVSLRPIAPDNAPPYRYADKADASRMLARLFPDVAPSQKRVVPARRTGSAESEES